MMDYQEKKLKPANELSKSFCEKYLDMGQFVHNNYGDVAIDKADCEEGQAGFPDSEELMKALKRIKALE